VAVCDGRVAGPIDRSARTGKYNRVFAPHRILARVHPTGLLRYVGTIALALGLISVGCATGSAQELRKPPLRILVGFPAGGTADMAARLLANELKNSLGRPVIVDNKPGASGRIAAMALKNATPDAATIMLAPIVATVLAPLVWSHLDYDPGRDFAPVAHVANYPVALAVNVGNPAQNLSEFVAWAKASPSRANYGVSSAGNLPHLFGVIVGQATGMPWVAVPYRGSAPMETDLAGGQIVAAMDALSSLIELHRAGKIRIIATSGVSRSTLLPEVPTFREQGLEKIEGNGWIAMYAPAGTSKAAIDEISAAIAGALRTPQVREQLIRLGYEPMSSTADELKTIESTEVARWRPIIKAVGFSAD
jgi:tripartite-type tricarboxylate transporter receptor subunit TctC